MARVTHVKRARQRYKMVPTLDESGQPIKVQVLRGDGQPKLSRKGRPIFQTQSTPDKTQPLPNRHCGRCNVEIKPGDPYKWIAPRSGPYGGRKLYRCGACPTWQVWEYSSSLSARIQQIQHDATTDVGDLDSEGAMQDHLAGVAEQIRELAEEKRESAQSIEEGFGHSTYQSDELNEQADSLDDWANEVESADVPEVPEECGFEHPEPEPGEYSEECQVCAELDQFDLDSWRDDILSVIDNSPL